MVPDLDVSTLQSRAVAGGIGLLALATYLMANPFDVLWKPVAAALGSVPVTLCLFALVGGSGRRWAGIGLGTAFGFAVAEYLAVTGAA